MVGCWNVNSLKVRLPQLQEWIGLRSPALIGLQETKLVDADFPVAALAAMGYRCAFSGQKTYNGVALLSSDPLLDVTTVLPGMEDDPQKRFVAATCRGVRVVNVYVPNGESVGSDKFDYKLRWLRALRNYLEKEAACFEQLVVMGDFNIAPTDQDVHDPKRWQERIMCSTIERQALRTITDLGLRDTFRLHEQPDNLFSWWDYRTQAFRRNWGLRIDLILASDALSRACGSATIDLGPRRNDRPSDHAPVLADFLL